MANELTVHLVLGDFRRPWTADTLEEFQDLKTFAEDDFDPKKWINKAWSSCGNQEKEVFMANTVSRLQLYMKQLTNSLDETTTQIVTSVPRLLQDATSLQHEGELLQQKLRSLEEKVNSVEEETGHSIESLQKIDQLKGRLENAASALREADKWTALATSLEDTLETGVPTDKKKLSELSKQVASMTASLETMNESTDYETKRLQLETLYNRLEATVSPALIEVIMQMDADKTSSYVELFAGMNRSLSVYRCWRQAAANRLAADWRRLEVHSIHALTRLLAGEANKQVEWLVNVLKTETPLAELIRLYTDLLLSLDPPPTKVVSANLKFCSTPEEGILMLTDLRRDIDEFIACIRGVLESPKRSQETLEPSTLKVLGRAAYAPLRELLPRYKELQCQVLLGHLQDPQLEQEDLLERSRAFLSLAERFETWLNSARTKANKIAGDAVYPYYNPAVDAFVSSVSSKISSHSRAIESSFLASLTAGHTTGVLSTTFPASLALETATALLLDTLAEQQRVLVEENEGNQENNPLLDLPTLLLEAETRERLSSIKADPVPSTASLRRLKDQLRGLARAILRSPVDAQLDKIPQLSVWNNNDAISTDLPDFALSPQEYITEIGQYLMTLPQHLELHLSEKQTPLHFLNELCIHTCDMYAEKILNIRNMDALGTKRCLTDIVYLSSVVEDLGSNVTPALKNLEKSLRVSTGSSNE